MKFFKNLFRRVSSESKPQRGSIYQPGVGTPVPTLGTQPPNSPNSERVESNPNAPSSLTPISQDNANSKLQTQNSTFSLTPDPDNKRNGKIARLPRGIRDKINECLASGQSAVSITRQLNKLPEVKTVLQTHFGGRPILPQNLSEWKAGGYRDWLLRQELLFQQKELAADAQQMGQIAENMGNSLLGMLLLDYAHLLKNAANDTPEAFEQKRNGLSVLVKDIVKLRRCELMTRSVEVQEGQLEQGREKTQEEVFQKFAEWAQHPAIRKIFFLEPQTRMAELRATLGRPPTPEDQALLKELGLKKTKQKEKNQTERKPTQTENSQTEKEVGQVPHACAPNAPSSITPISEDEAPKSHDQNTGSTAIPSPLPSDGRGEGKGEVRVCTTNELHSSSHISSPISPISTPPDNSKLTTQNSKLSGGSPWDTFSEPCYPGAPRLSQPQPQPVYRSPLGHY